MLGIPTGMSVDTNDTYALVNPYYAWYGQDTWRVTRNLTLTLGLRMEYEMGPKERYNRALSYFDPELILPISAGAQAAYARNPMPELPASQFVVKGGSVYTGVNGVSREVVEERADVAAEAFSGLSSECEDDRPRRVRHLLRHVERDESGGGSIRLLASHQHGADATISDATWLAGDPQNGKSPLSDPFPVQGGRHAF